MAAREDAKGAHHLHRSHAVSEGGRTERTCALRRDETTRDDAAPALPTLLLLTVLTHDYSQLWGLT